MLNIEVQSSTMLSQVELCFICPEFSFFFAKSCSIPVACCICTMHRLTLLQVHCWYISSFFLFLLTSSLAQLQTPRVHHGPTTDHNDMSMAMMHGEHCHATRASLPSDAFFFFSFLFFLLISSFVVQSLQSHMAQRQPPRPQHHTAQQL